MIGWVMLWGASGGPDSDPRVERSGSVSEDPADRDSSGALGVVVTDSHTLQEFDLNGG